MWCYHIQLAHIILGEKWLQLGWQILCTKNCSFWQCLAEVRKMWHRCCDKSSWEVAMITARCNRAWWTTWWQTLKWVRSGLKFTRRSITRPRSCGQPHRYVFFVSWSNHNSNEYQVEMNSSLFTSCVFGQTWFMEAGGTSAHVQCSAEEFAQTPVLDHIRVRYIGDGKYTVLLYLNIATRKLHHVRQVYIYMYMCIYIYLYVYIYMYI